MSDTEKTVSEPLQGDLDAIANLVKATAAQSAGDGLALLKLLRLLESLHHDIRDDLFQETLPRNRQSLYALLKDMEAEGGWPYISRMKLRSLLQYLFNEECEVLELNNSSVYEE